MSCILVVEDDRVVREVVSDALVDAGYAVASAADGADALDQLHDHPADVILLDLMMPIMDGFSFMEACHQEQLCNDVPIVVISAAHDALRRMRDVPVHACIAKPFDLDDLVRTVGQYARPNGAL